MQEYLYLNIMFLCEDKHYHKKKMQREDTIQWQVERCFALKTADKGWGIYMRKVIARGLKGQYRIEKVGYARERMCVVPK
jgi:hypothetical protein